MLLAGCQSGGGAPSACRRGPGEPCGVRAREPAVLAYRFEEPAGAGRGDARFLRVRGLLEEAAEAVGEWVGLARPVPVVVRSCGGEGSSYDPEEQRVEICYEEVSETRDLFRATGCGRADEEVAAVLLETVLHETAHALVDVLALRVTGREEDFADQFAALVLLDGSAVGERRLRAAAEAWRLSARLTEDAGETDGKQAPDEHAPDHERAVNEYCYVYGSAPGRHGDLVGPDTLPAERAPGCAEEWTDVRADWLTALGPAGRDPDA